MQDLDLDRSLLERFFASASLCIVMPIFLPLSLGPVSLTETASDLMGADLVALRKREASPMLVSIGNLFDAIAEKYCPKSPVARAIGYARGQWLVITRYVEIADARMTTIRRSKRSSRWSSDGKIGCLQAAPRAGAGQP